ncbi:MAG TPA: hypothetical protein VGY53_05205 [Isosphaeraceae bacterium]|jgi:hypothetical protein|nr:hypothetical protein [Isosphaeraceae bacterium]
MFLGLPAGILVVCAIGLALGVGGLGVWQRAHFVIHHVPGREVRVKGRIPNSKVGSIKGFFARDLGASGAVKVRGLFGPGRVLKLRFSGPLSAGQRQRVRNFLVDQLR